MRSIRHPEKKGSGLKSAGTQQNVIALMMQGVVAYMESPDRVPLTQMTSMRFEERGCKPRGGKPRLWAITTRVSCDCDDTDIDMNYRMCCLTVGDSPSYRAVVALLLVMLYDD